MATTNPLRLVYEAIWSFLEAQPDFAAGVPVGDRIKYTGTDPYVDKETLTQSDYPQVRVVARGLAPHLERTSNASSVNVLWMIEISSGTQRFATLFDVEWWILQAMVDWRTHMSGLAMGASGYVTNCRPVQVKTDLGGPQRDKGNKGWSSVWAGETEIWLKTSEL